MPAAWAQSFTLTSFGWFSMFYSGIDAPPESPIGYGGRGSLWARSSIRSTWRGSRTEFVRLQRCEIFR